MARALWVMCNCALQLLLQTHYLVFERLNICKPKCELIESNSENARNGGDCWTYRAFVVVGTISHLPGMSLHGYVRLCHLRPGKQWLGCWDHTTCLLQIRLNYVEWLMSWYEFEVERTPALYVIWWCITEWCKWRLEMEKNRKFTRLDMLSTPEEIFWLLGGWDLGYFPVM